MSTYIDVASLADIPPGVAAQVEVNGQHIGIYNVDGTLHALDGVCPHAGGPLGQGQLDGCVVTCPWHGWQFDVTSGQHCLTEAIRHTSFPVIVEGDDVLVELP